MADTAKGQVEVVELSRAQQGAVRRMAEARATVPAFTVGEDAPPVGLPGLVSAIAAALREQPEVNGAYRDGRLERYHRVNVAVVMPAADGPVSPVVFDADTKDAGAIAAELDELNVRAQAGELTAAELAGATFVVTPTGARRVEPVLLPGFAAALGAGRIELTLACDARALSAADAATFLSRIRTLLA